MGRDDGLTDGISHPKSGSITFVPLEFLNRFGSGQCKHHPIKLYRATSINLLGCVRSFSTELMTYFQRVRNLLWSAVRVSSCLPDSPVLSAAFPLTKYYRCFPRVSERVVVFFLLAWRRDALIRLDSCTNSQTSL